MTTVSFANETSTVEVPTLELNCKRRFNLRKRSLCEDERNMNLSSYNSAFLSGLFADVAQASQDQDEGVEADSSATTTATATSDLEEVEDPRLDDSLPVKRSRVSLTQSISRSGRSYKDLADVVSPVGVDTQFSSHHENEDTTTNSSSSMSRINSLHFQLNCVSSKPELLSNRVSPTCVKECVDLKNRVFDIIDMAFPHLPATVSDSSCEKQDLTPKSDRQMSDREKSSNKESYGWFVDLDAGEDDEEGIQRDGVVDPYARSTPTSELAFTAPTAPKRLSNYEAEVEWAKAADTVDDVLGDFF